MINLSVIAPAYNEGEGIKSIVTEWISFLRKNEPNYEIVICDDGSKDNTWKVLQKLARKNKRIKTIKHKENQGAGAAITTAIKYSKGKLVLMLDSDGQFPIKEYTKLKRALVKRKLDAVIGLRRSKKNTIALNIGSFLSTVFLDVFLGSRVRDFNSVFKLVKGDLIRGLNLDAKRFEVSTDITAKLLEADVRIGETIITHKERAAGTSSLKFLYAMKNRFLFAVYLVNRKLLINLDIIRKGDSEIIRGVNLK